MGFQSMKKLFLIKLFIFISLLSPFAWGKDTSFLDYTKFQFAGEIGFVSVGVGKEFTSWYQLTLMYGVVPAFLDVDDIHTIALKNDFNLYKYEDRFRLYFDATIFMALGKKFWPAFHSDDMGAWYYYNSGSDFLLSLGSEYYFFDGKLGLYGEYGVVGQWLYFYLKNRETVEFSTITSLTVGLNYYF